MKLVQIQSCQTQGTTAITSKPWQKRQQQYSRGELECRESSVGGKGYCCTLGTDLSCYLIFRAVEDQKQRFQRREREDRREFELQKTFRWYYFW
jgi:hypothetical protein